MSELPEFLKDTAFISNSGSMLGSNQGSRIDSYKNVARFNNYQISPHLQKDVGSKVNIWVTSLCYMPNKACHIKPRGEEYDLVLAIVPKELAARSMKDMVSRYNVIYMPNRLYFSIGYFGCNRPSTGLLMLWWLWNDLGLGYFNPCNHFGFDFFSGNRVGSKTHHYYESWRPRYNNHNHNDEKRLYNAMSEGFSVKHKILLFSGEYAKNLWLDHEEEIKKNCGGYGLI